MHMWSKHIICRRHTMRRCLQPGSFAFAWYAMRIDRGVGDSQVDYSEGCTYKCMQRCISWPNTGMGTHPTQRAAERALPAPPAANRQQGPFIQPPTLACPHAANNTAHRCSRYPPRHIARQLSSPMWSIRNGEGGGRRPPHRNRPHNRGAGKNRGKRTHAGARAAWPKIPPPAAHPTRTVGQHPLRRLAFFSRAVIFSTCRSRQQRASSSHTLT